MQCGIYDGFNCLWKVRIYPNAYTSLPERTGQQARGSWSRFDGVREQRNVLLLLLLLLLPPGIQDLAKVCLGHRTL